jgi:hypothetical protein
MTTVGSTTAVFLLGLIALTPPAQADPSEASASLSQDLALQRAIAGLQPQGNDFFEQGRARFEAEVEHLLQEQDDADTPLLTINGSIWVEPEAVEHPDDQQAP